MTCFDGGEWSGGFVFQRLDVVPELLGENLSRLILWLGVLCLFNALSLYSTI